MHDKLEIAEVINRYFAALDRRTFDAESFNQIFAVDATVVRPNGQRLTGPDEIRTSHSKSLERFRATQHLTSGFIVDMADDAIAEFRVNLIAWHFWKEGLGDSSVKQEDNYFLAGGVVSGDVTKTSNDWRIVTIRNDVIWRKGVGFQDMINIR